MKRKHMATQQPAPERPGQASKTWNHTTNPKEV
jgi:hypothetical protein